jgi:hypothetical protein
VVQKSPTGDDTRRQIARQRHLLAVLVAEAGAKATLRADALSATRTLVRGQVSAYRTLSLMGNEIQRKSVWHAACITI